MDQHSPATLRLLSDAPGELGQVGEHVLRLGVLQGQLHSVEGGEAGQLLAHVDDEGGLQSGQGGSRQCRSGAQVEIRGDLSYL